MSILRGCLIQDILRAGKFGRLDILVNCAAGNFLSPAEALSTKGFKTVMEIDTIGSFNMALAAFPALKVSHRCGMHALAHHRSAWPLSFIREQHRPSCVRPQQPRPAMPTSSTSRPASSFLRSFKFTRRQQRLTPPLPPPVELHSFVLGAVLETHKTDR